mgnify:CR=1 FL=1
MVTRLEDYWGVGPKTAALLRDELGTEDAVAAIEAGDVSRLVQAGVPRGRATRVLRRANGGPGMDVLATDDTRSVYKQLLSLAARHALTERAADRIYVTTPFREPDPMCDRIDRVVAARDAWRSLDESTQREAETAFDTYDDLGGGERAAVETAIALRELDLPADSTFGDLLDLDSDALTEATDALRHLTPDGVAEGADATLDRLQRKHDAVLELDRDAFAVVDALRDEGVRGTDEFREAFVQYVANETDVAPERVREAAHPDAMDAADFVANSLRDLRTDLEARVDERRTQVRSDLRKDVVEAQDTIDDAVDAVTDLAFYLSLARFADAYDLTRPTIVEDRDVLAVQHARNLDLAAAGTDLQPVTYAVGDHALSAAGGGGTGDGTGTSTDTATAPSGDRVTVLTGANSGGKTTLLETLCEVQLLASMGLPVPAEAAEVGVVDAIVFHRRHASFNAGVLESTLRSVVPPLARGDRTLMLVDEFEAITEPGSAADLLHGLVTLTVDQDALGVYVTHLADDLEPLPTPARTDGIFAQGLDANLELRVDYQPRFGVVGKSTPEFIVSRLVAHAGDAYERAGYEALARAVGEEAVQRTLSDVEWGE